MHNKVVLQGLKGLAVATAFGLTCFVLTRPSQASPPYELSAQDMADIAALQAELNPEERDRLMIIRPGTGVISNYPPMLDDWHVVETEVPLDDEDDEEEEDEEIPEDKVHVGEAEGVELTDPNILQDPTQTTTGGGTSSGATGGTSGGSTGGTSGGSSGGSTGSTTGGDGGGTSGGSSSGSTGSTTGGSTGGTTGGTSGGSTGGTDGGSTGGTTGGSSGGTSGGTTGGTSGGSTSGGSTGSGGGGGGGTTPQGLPQPNPATVFWNWDEDWNRALPAGVSDERVSTHNAALSGHNSGIYRRIMSRVGNSFIEGTLRLPSSSHVYLTPKGWKTPTEYAAWLANPTIAVPERREVPWAYFKMDIEKPGMQTYAEGGFKYERWKTGDVPEPRGWKASVQYKRRGMASARSVQATNHRRLLAVAPLEVRVRMRPVRDSSNRKYLVFTFWLSNQHNSPGESIETIGIEQNQSNDAISLTGEHTSVGYVTSIAQIEQNPVTGTFEPKTISGTQSYVIGAGWAGVRIAPGPPATPPAFGTHGELLVGSKLGHASVHPFSQGDGPNSPSSYVGKSYAEPNFPNTAWHSTLLNIINRDPQR